MKKYIRKVLIYVLAVTVAFFAVSCYDPSPLYGKWADNSGSYITFADDGTFVANIYERDDSTKVVNYQGTFTVIDNVLSFSVSEPDGFNINTEWDIRGSLLYLDWTFSDGTSRSLTLYHVSK
ncbi:MAG: hypothetical protein PUI24_03600 [Spirochaetales bacterium]|nr:hypothetical protein [Spirochaetales bacterium]